MNLLTLFRLFTSGFSSTDPNIEEEGKKLEAEEKRLLTAKEEALAGFKRLNRFDDSYQISRFFREEGRQINVGAVTEVEVWEKGEHLRLAVKKDKWEVYVLLPDIAAYQLRRRLV